MTDLGTEFQVFDDPVTGPVEVLVTEGMVLVESPSDRRILLAGQRVRLGRNGRFPATLEAEQLSTRDILRTTAWRERRLELDGETQPHDRIERSRHNSIFNAGEDSNSFRFFANRYVRHSIDIYGGTGRLQQAFGDNVELTLPGNIQWADQTSGGNGDGTPDPQFRFDFTESLRQASVEARLWDRSGAKVDWVVGLFNIDDKIAFASLWTSFAVRSICISPIARPGRAARHSASSMPKSRAGCA